VLNLLSNAIKFGGGEPIEVRCSSTEDGSLVLEVADHGRGIEPENLERIFDEFVQLSNPDHQHGTGLGLAISRRLARLLGGTLNVTSTVGKGSVFRLQLPNRMDVQALAGGGVLGPDPTPQDGFPAARAG
jgi:signal transduction histidine kinase